MEETTSLTEELRRMLDEREVEWDGTDSADPTKGHPTSTSLGSEYHDAVFIEYTDGFVLRLFDLTPEQAIVATFGSGMCRMEPVKNYQVSKYATSWGCVCSNCGTFHEFTNGEGWKYCPTCRAEVVDA